jgi:hypothetical protein
MSEKKKVVTAPNIIIPEFGAPGPKLEAYQFHVRACPGRVEIQLTTRSKKTIIGMPPGDARELARILAEHAEMAEATEAEILEKGEDGA